MNTLPSGMTTPVTSCENSAKMALSAKGKRRKQNNQEDPKRLRNPDWEENEKEILIKMISDNHAILFGKFSAKVSNARKSAIWDTILKCVNAKGGCNRTLDQIKKKFSNMKSNIKQIEAQNRRAKNKTGGGTPEHEITLNEGEKILCQLIPDIAIEGIPGGIDSYEFIKEKENNCFTAEEEEESNLALQSVVYSVNNVIDMTEFEEEDLKVCVITPTTDQHHDSAVSVTSQQVASTSQQVASTSQQVASTSQHSKKVWKDKNSARANVTASLEDDKRESQQRAKSNRELLERQVELLEEQVCLFKEISVTLKQRNIIETEKLQERRERTRNKDNQSSSDSSS